MIAVELCPTVNDHNSYLLSCPPHPALNHTK